MQVANVKFFVAEVCVCLNVLLPGQYHHEEGLGEWVEFTGGQRFFNPPSLVLKAKAPTTPS